MKTKELTFTALFAALSVVGAFLKINIPLPLYTMHFTLQWFFVLMAGFILGSRLGALSVMVYLLLGLSGLPVFASGGGIGLSIRNSGHSRAFCILWIWCDLFLLYEEPLCWRCCVFRSCCGTILPDNNYS